MKLTDRERKLLWTRAGNHCSYRHHGEICDQPLTYEEGSANVVIGEECHIVGEMPGSARYVEDFPSRETYSNGILLCPKHHKLIDDNETRDSYPVDLVRAMKREHEATVCVGAQAMVLEDSTFSAEVENADCAIALDVSTPAKLSGVDVNLKAGNVREACAARFSGPVHAAVAFCDVCGTPMTGTGVGGAPVQLRCPKCGKLKKG